MYKLNCKNYNLHKSVCKGKGVKTIANALLIIHAFSVFCVTFSLTLQTCRFSRVLMWFLEDLSHFSTLYCRFSRVLMWFWEALSHFSTLYCRFSRVLMWFWEALSHFSTEDMARFVQGPEFIR